MATDTKTAAPAGKELAGLTPAEGVQQLLAQRQRQLAEHYTLFIEQDGEEALHDFRVALRRMRTLLRHYRTVIGCDKKLLPQLREMQVMTNSARDIEVFIVQLKQLAPECTHLIDELERQQQEAYQRLRQELPISWATISPQLSQARPMMAPQGHASLACLTSESGLQQLKKLKRGFRSLQRQWGAAQLHRLRIRGKRLRYLLEPFSELSRCADAITLMKQFQDELGDHRDLQLLFDWLQQENLAPDGLITALQARLQQQEHRLRRLGKQEGAKKIIKPLHLALKQLCMQ